MERRKQSILNTINTYLKKTQGCIKQKQDYLAYLQDKLKEYDNLEWIQCPLCQGEAFIAPDTATLLLQDDWNSYRLGEETKYGFGYRPYTSGLECFDCSLVEARLEKEPQYVWTRDNMPRDAKKLPYQLLSNFKQISKVRMIFHRAGDRVYTFDIGDKVYTFWHQNHSDILDKLGLLKPLKEKLEKSPKLGFVYLIESENGAYKIGCSKNVKKRYQLFTVKLPFKVDLVHSFPADDMRSAEGKLHNLYNDDRINGEWFNLQLDNVQDLTEISEYKQGRFIYQ